MSLSDNDYLTYMALLMVCYQNVIGKTFIEVQIVVLIIRIIPCVRWKFNAATVPFSLRGLGGNKLRFICYLFS